jgi:DNA-binding transcriptional LysR family regulator
MKSVRSKIADLKGVRRGRVVIAVDDNVATIRSFAQEIATYQSAFEGVSFTIETTAKDDIAQTLSDYRADLALQLHPRTNPNIASLCTTPVGVIVVGRKDHPGLGNGPVRCMNLPSFLGRCPRAGRCAKPSKPLRCDKV